MDLFKYYLEDAREGFRRNLRAVFSAILLMTISLSITSSLFLVKSSADDVVHFLETQVRLKVLVNNQLDIHEVDEILKNNSFVKSTSIEMKEETLNQLKSFFKGKEHLFLAFNESTFPNSIAIELKDNENMETIVGELEKINGIEQVIHPQEFATFVMNMSENISQYGMVVLGVFILSSFLTVSLAISLSMYQRQKEIRVKLLVGAKESHVKGQFIFEGSLMGLISSVFSCLIVYSLYEAVFYKLSVSYSFLFRFDSFTLNMTLLGVVAAGTLIGTFGSWIATRRMIEHA